jgi:hypothetical protein
VMPTAPALPPELSQMQQGPSSANLLMSAADLHNSGQLPGSDLADATPRSVIPRGKALQTGKALSRKAKIKVIK